MGAFLGVVAVVYSGFGFSVGERGEGGGDVRACFGAESVVVED